MKLLPPLGVLALSSILGLGSVGGVTPQTAAVTGFVPGRLDAVSTFVQRHVDSGQLPGAVLLLARHGKVGVVRAFGMADLASRTPMRPDSLFRLASASKIMTTVGLLALCEAGRCALSDAVGAHLPELRQLQVRHSDGTVRPAAGRLTIRDLLRHTAGYGYGGDAAQLAAYQGAGLMPAGRDDDWSHALTSAQWAATLAKVPLDAEPGTRFEYGLGHDIAGALIERLSGQSLDVFLRDRVFVPLGMADTVFTVTPAMTSRMTTLYEASPVGFTPIDDGRRSRFLSPPRAWSGGGGWDMAGHGGVVTTAQDLFRFLQMILDGGTRGPTRILSRASVELMRVNQLSGLARPERTPGVGFGFGFAVLVDPARYGDVGAPGLMWWAGSTNTRYWIDPASGMVGVYLTQVLPFPYLDLMNAVMRSSIQALE